MPSDVGILGAWALLQGAGLARPWLTDSAAEQGVTTWRLVMADVSDERLAALTVAWLRSPDSKYGRWPTPGALLCSLPDAEDIDDSDEAWSEALHLLQLLPWHGQRLGTHEDVERLRRRLQVFATGPAGRADSARKALLRLPSPDELRTEALLAGVRACGGWAGLGACHLSDVVAHRASFRSVYRSLLMRAQRAEAEERVSSLFDALPPQLQLVANQVYPTRSP